MRALLIGTVLLICAGNLPAAGGGTPHPLVASLALLQDTSSDADSLLKQAYDLKAQGKRDEARTLFEKIMRDYPKTSAGVEARWMVAYYLLNDKQFDDAQRLFQQVASDALAKPDIAAEALLQTGFVYISRYWAEANAPGEQRFKLLEQAESRLLQIARSLSNRSDDIGRTAAAYALLGVGEAWLYRGMPESAEPHYRAILAMKDGVHPVVTAQAWYCLGVSLYRQRRYGEALQAFEAVKQIGEAGEGIVLRSLALGNALPERAWLWQATIWAQLGYAERSVAALEEGLRRPERLAGASNAALLAQAQKSLEGMRRVVERLKEREKRLAEVKRLAQQLEQSTLSRVSPATQTGQ